jgi:hypothetical protein
VPFRAKCSLDRIRATGGDQLPAAVLMCVHMVLQEFEIFISPEQYAAAGIAHLHLPTIDFLYAPPVGEMHRGVDFIHGEAWRALPLFLADCQSGIRMLASMTDAGI